MLRKPKPAGHMRKLSLRLHVALLSRRVAKSEEGATAIEYAVIAAGIGATVAATVYSVGTTTASLYQTVAAVL